MDTPRLSKEDLRDPDLFISSTNRIGEWAFAHRRTILSLAVLLMVGGIAWAIMGISRTHREDSAQDDLFLAEKKMHAAADKFKKTEPEAPAADEDSDDATKGAKNQKPDQKSKLKSSSKGKAGGPAGTNAAKPAVQPSGDLETDYPGVVGEFRQVAQKHPGTQAAVFADLEAADLLEQHKKYDDALPLVQEASKTASHPVSKALASLSLGRLYEAKGDCAKAVEQWQVVQKDNDMAAFRAGAMVKSALCYEKMGQAPKAQELYEKLESADQKLKTLSENTAKGLGLNTQLPMEMQPPDRVKKFQDALARSGEFKELEALVSDRNAVKAAKKYLKIMKRSAQG